MKVIVALNVNHVVEVLKHLINVGSVDGVSLMRNVLRLANSVTSVMAIIILVMYAKLERV